MTTATIRIQRFNPDIDSKPTLQAYTLTISPETTILDALEEIKARQDGSLTFRRSCRHAICGSCAMNVNGRNMLVCNRPIQTLLNNDRSLTIRPLPYLPVIKDLVVDRSLFWEQYQRIKPWLVPDEISPGKEYRITPAEVDALLDAEKCIMCGACYAACPIAGANPKYLGPHALEKQYLRIMDPRDSITHERLNQIEIQGGIYGCRTVSTCLEDCPKGLNPTRTIATLKHIALRRRRFEAERETRRQSLR